MLLEQQLCIGSKLYEAEFCRSKYVFLSELMKPYIEGLRLVKESPVQTVYEDMQCFSAFEKKEPAIEFVKRTKNAILLKRREGLCGGKRRKEKEE